MRPVERQQVICNMRRQVATVVMCQAGYVFVNFEKLPTHEVLQAKIHDRAESGVILESVSAPIILSRFRLAAGHPNHD